MRHVRPFRSAAVAAALAALGVGSCAPSPASGTADFPRPVVLLLHGRGMQGQDSASLRLEWVSALDRGLAALGADAPLAHDDVRLVWYADALDPRAPAACAGGRRGGIEVGPGAEIESVLGTIGALMGMAAEWVGEQGGPGLRSVAGDLLYFGDDEKRCAAEERLDEALDRAAAEGRPVVLVAHSFGSLLAYRHLHGRSAERTPEIERLVTVGSLVGVPELRQLLFGQAGRARGLPPGVRSWVNVRDPRDPFAAPLMGVRSDAVDPAAIVDRTTEAPAPGDVHPAPRYLADPATARAVLEAWCAASGPLPPRPCHFLQP